MPQIVHLSAHQIVELVATGDLTRVEVIQAHLDRVLATNEAAGALGSVRGEAALQEAAEADAAGQPRGRLDGVPVSVKAEYDVAGLPTSHGNRLAAENRALVDSPVVARLRAQGAIVVGKANQPDFAMRWNTHSSEIGWTRNPRDLSLSAGGSSGGDAAAVAAGMVALGFGTDLAGSIRVPAAFCSVYGLRSTPGRIPFASEDRAVVRTPAAEAMGSQGPLARSVDDLGLAFRVTAGGHPQHPFSAPSARWSDAPGQPTRLRAARVVDQAGAEISGEMVSETDRICRALHDDGYAIEDLVLPGLERVPDLWGELLCTELRLRALPHLRDTMDPSSFDHIDKLSQVWPTILDTDTYLQRWQELAQIKRRLADAMESTPIIVAPAVGMRVPLPLEYDEWATGADIAALAIRMRNCLWPSALGLPAIGLPNGVQLVGAPHRDETLFAPARTAEAVLPSSRPADPVAA